MNLDIDPIGNMREGDLFGYLGKNIGSQWINIVTYGIPFFGLSHIAILAKYQGELVLFESTTWNDKPCIIQNKCVKGVQAHHLAERLIQYDGKIWHYPLSRRIREYESQDLTDFLMKQIGKSYDTIGAFRSGGRGFNWIERHLHKESLHTLFCSELCAAAHREINRFETRDASCWNPNSLVREETYRGTLSKRVRLL